MHFIWSLIVGALIGFIAGAVTRRGEKMGMISNVLAGLVGSFLGELIFGSWGPRIAGMSVIPSIIGAIILVLIVSAILGSRKSS